MKKTMTKVVLVPLLILAWSLPSLAQEAEHQEHSKYDEDTEAVEHEEQDEELGGRPHHKNDIGIFVGFTDERGHALEPTLGIDYGRIVTDRLAVGALFEYAGGELRNGIFAASISWLPISHFQLTAAPGVKFHRGRGPTVDCGCGGAREIDDQEQAGLVDEDATYFVLRLGAGWHFPIGLIYGILPTLNVDFVDGEKVWVYGVNFTVDW